MFKRTSSAALALLGTAFITQNAAAQFARPPGHDHEPSEPIVVDPGPRYEEDDPAFPSRSTARLHVGPATLFSPVSTNAGGGGRKLVAQFNKADIDNNTPEGDSVPLVLTVNVLQNGVQKQLSSTALVKVEK